MQLPNLRNENSIMYIFKMYFRKKNKKKQNVSWSTGKVSTIKKQRSPNFTLFWIQTYHLI